MADSNNTQESPPGSSAVQKEHSHSLAGLLYVLDGMGRQYKKDFPDIADDIRILAQKVRVKFDALQGL